MTVKGYTSKEDVAAYLGKTLTEAQDGFLDIVILPAVEAWIDLRAARAWAVTATVTAEYHRVIGTDLYLDKFPITSVTKVDAYTGSVGATAKTLVAATDYEIRLASKGYLVLAPGPQAYHHVLVDYVPNTGAPPADITLAATMIAADWLQPALNAGNYGISEYQVGSELRVKYAEGAWVGAKDWDVPDLAREIVDNYRRDKGGVW